VPPTARTTCPAKVKTKGSAGVQGLRFQDIVRSAPDGEIRCRALENNWVNVTYQRSSFKLVGLPNNDFPKLPRVPEPIAKVDAALLADRLCHVAEESRYVLNGALLKLHSDSVTMVATDGHRLAPVERKHQSPGLTEGVPVLVRRNALIGLRCLADEGSGGVGGDQVVIARQFDLLPFTGAVPGPLDVDLLPGKDHAARLPAQGTAPASGSGRCGSPRHRLVFQNRMRNFLSRFPRQPLDLGLLLLPDLRQQQLQRQLPSTNHSDFQVDFLALL
jgi:DNA polymerase III beta subunit, central domain